MVQIGVQKVNNGMKLEYKNDVWTIVEFHHLKPGKGGAFVRMKIKSLTTGRVLEENFQASNKVEQTDVATRRMAYLYKDASDFVFMDNESYEQLSIESEKIGNQVNFLTENLEVLVMIWKEKVLSVELPVKIEMEVTETMQADKGNTATNVTKDATVETGYVAQVPLFVNNGDRVILDTRDGSYVSRA